MTGIKLALLGQVAWLNIYFILFFDDRCSLSFIPRHSKCLCRPTCWVVPVDVAQEPLTRSSSQKEEEQHTLVLYFSERIFENEKIDAS